MGSAIRKGMGNKWKHTMDVEKSSSDDDEGI